MRGTLLVIVAWSLRVPALQPIPDHSFRVVSPSALLEELDVGQKDTDVDSAKDGREYDQLEDEESNKNAVIFVKNPVPTMLAGIAEAERSEASSHDIEFVRHRLFNVSIPIYQSKDQISEAIRANGSWDTEDLQRICRAYLEHGGKGHILDVGANIGSYSLPLASFVKSHSVDHHARVVAVEGFPKNARHLRAGMRLNNLDNVVLYEYALSSPIQDNTVDMKENGKNKGMNKVSSKLRSRQRDKNKLAVPVTTLDAIAASTPELLQNIFLMKMDIEGSEADALRGANNFLQRGPCVVYVETKYNDKLVGIFQEKGYVLQTLEGPDKNAWFEAHDMKKCVANLK